MSWLTESAVAGDGPRLFGPALLFALVLAEAALGAWRRPGAYDLGESAATLAIMIGQRLIALATAPLLIALFLGAQALQPFGAIPMGPLGIALLFLAVEFCYYGHHRAMHRFRLLWASHGVHHSTSRMNLLAAFRLGWGGQLTGGFLFYLPLVVVGFPAPAVLAMLGLNLFWQIFLHASWTPSLGPLEAVLNTPRHHHVHHAANLICIDRNFGGVTILFDRLFGTFQAVPAEPLRYGRGDGVPTRNPLAVALGGWLDVGRRVVAARGAREVVAALFGRP